MRDFTKMSNNRLASPVASRTIRVFARLSVVIACKRDMFDSTMNARFFKGFKCSGLRMGQSGLNSAFRKDPVADACPHQEEFRSAGADAVANCGNLLATSEIGRTGSDKSRSQSLCRNRCAHTCRVIDSCIVCLDQNLVHLVASAATDRESAPSLESLCILALPSKHSRK